MRRAPQLGQNPRRSPKAPTVGTTERDQALLVARFPSHAQKTVFEPPALQVVFEFPLHIVRQYPAVLGQLLPEHRVVLRYQLIEECLLGPMALIVRSTGVRAGIPCRNNGGHDSRPSAAMALWGRMIPSLLCIWRGQYIAKVKAASRMRGFDAGAVRAPLRELDAESMRELANCLEALDQE